MLAAAPLALPLCMPICRHALVTGCPTLAALQAIAMQPPEEELSHRSINAEPSSCEAADADAAMSASVSGENSAAGRAVPRFAAAVRTVASMNRVCTSLRMKLLAAPVPDPGALQLLYRHC